MRKWLLRCRCATFLSRIRIVSERRLLWDYKVSINGVVCYPDERYLFAGLMYLRCITKSRCSGPAVETLLVAGVFGCRLSYGSTPLY